MAMSLEEYADKYGRYPSADWFCGRRVSDVKENPEPSVAWAIMFEGDGMICNYDPLVLNPGRRIVGQALSQVVQTKKQTELRFAMEKVVLNPLQWSMRDGVLTMGEMVFAQRSRLNMPMEAQDGS